MTWMCLSNRLSALKSLLHNLLQAEDIVKVNEARLTEKETSSLDPKEVVNYQGTLKVRHAAIIVTVLDSTRVLLSSGVQHVY